MEKSWIHQLNLTWRNIIEYCRFSLCPSFLTNQKVFDTNNLLLRNTTCHFGVHFHKVETGESECNVTPAPLLSCQANSAQSLQYLLDNCACSLCTWASVSAIIPTTFRLHSQVEGVLASHYIAESLTHSIHFTEGNDWDYFCANSANEQLP